MCGNHKKINANFWQDNFVVKLNLEEKLFYNYMITNSRTNHCGIYNFSILFAAIELGLSEERVQELLDIFCKYEKILYDESTEEIMILNWYKHNIEWDNETIKIINLELKDIKNKEFIKKFYDLCKTRNVDINIIFENISLNEEASQKNKTSETLINKIDIKELDGVLDAFNANIHTATLMEIQELKKLCSTMGEETVILAITEAVNNNIKNLRYIKGIIFNWKASGLKSAEDVKNYLSNKEKNKNKQ